MFGREGGIIVKLERIVVTRGLWRRRQEGGRRGLKGQLEAGSRSAAAAGWEPEAVAVLGNDENLLLAGRATQLPT